MGRRYTTSQDGGVARERGGEVAGGLKTRRQREVICEGEMVAVGTVSVGPSAGANSRVVEGGEVVRFSLKGERTPSKHPLHQHPSPHASELHAPSAFYTWHALLSVGAMTPRRAPTAMQT